MGSCFSQGIINLHRHRMRAAEHAPRGPFRVLERRHGLAEIVEPRGSPAERPRVRIPYLESGNITLSKNASCHRRHFA